MSNPKDNKPSSVFQKVLELGNTYLDSQIFKAKTSIINANVEEDFLYSKTILEDPNYSTHAQGWKDKPYRVQNSHLKQMSTQDSVIASVIQTRQNQASAHSKLVKSKQEKGFMILLADEDSLLEKIKEELRGEMEAVQAAKKPKQDEAPETSDESDDQDPEIETGEVDTDEPVEKSDMEPTEQVTSDDDTSLEDAEDDQEGSEDDNEKPDDEVELFNWELERKAREKLNKQFEKARKDVEQYLLNCGKLENRPFETKRWTLDGALRAWTRDSLTYDLYATEIVPDRAGRPHHWFPADGGTIKYSSASLKNYKDMAETFINLDILYPEKTQIAEEKQKVIDLDPKLLEKDQYKYVQVIRGKVERAYTPDELKVGIRNVTTDIYNNGYGVSELELLVSLVTGHLNAEFYNQAYFTQGFSAKGILHIKQSLNRRKLETVRQQWQHMVKGARNSFQTPIFAGNDDVKWIPLTQNHNDIGFEGWMRYLVTLICAIYQIDPAELGIYFGEEGGSKGMKGDNTSEKLSQSKDKGLYPLMRHLEAYINEHIIKQFDPRFVIRFTGLADESIKQTLERQEKEVKFKKTVNEIRAEDGLPPLPGMDDVILDTNYMAWYNQYSDKATKKQEDQQQQMMDHQKDMAETMGQGDDGSGEEEQEEDPSASIYGDTATHLATPGLPDLQNPAPTKPNPFQKSFKRRKKSKKLSVEVYKLQK